MNKVKISKVDIRLTAEEARLNIARTWNKRISGLLKKRRKYDSAYSEAQFARDHNFDCGFLNRLKNIRVVPTQKTVELVEKALRKEGV
jgi:hypothetical protein